jgi:hypothetical protein
MESGGQPLHRDIFTWDHIWAYGWVGFHTALRDTLVWVVLYVVIGAPVYYFQEHYLTEKVTQIFIWNVSGSPIYWFIKMASFGGLFASTVMCGMMSRFYVGNIPKRAIHTLFVVRAIFLCTFSFLTFWLFGLLYKYLFNPEVITMIYTAVGRVSANHAQKIYLFINNYFRRALFEASITVIVASAISIIIPILTVGLYKIAGQRSQELGLDR